MAQRGGYAPSFQNVSGVKTPTDISKKNAIAILSLRNKQARQRNFPTWLSMKHVVGLHSSDLRDRGEDMSTVNSCSLQAVTMIDLPIASLFVNVKLQHTNTFSVRQRIFVHINL